MKKKIVVFISSILLLSNVCMPVMATSTSDLEQQKKEIEGQISEVKTQQKEVKEELNEQMKAISVLDTSIAETDAEIANLSSKILSLEEEIKTTQKQLEEKQEEYKKNKALMEDRLVAMYETGETSFLDMLFSSKSMVEFISNYYMLSEVTECDKELVSSLQKEKEEIANTKAKLERSKLDLDAAKKEQQTKNSLLKNQKAERQQKVNSLSEEEKKLQSDIDSYNAQVDKIETQIKKILEDLARKNAANSNGTTGASGLKFDGSFIWPCNTKLVTSTVKRRWGRMHKGIDIGANHESVYASASGYAYTLENPGGYGNYIMIIHGDGYITLYGHLLSRYVSYGQYVKQGQVIATSGGGIGDAGRGSSTGRHLHFEIRKASSISNFFSVSPLNPLDYLPGGYTFAAGAQTPS